MIPPKVVNGVVFPIDTVVASALISAVVATNSVSGLTSLISTLFPNP